MKNVLFTIVKFYGVFNERNVTILSDFNHVFQCFAKIFVLANVFTQQIKIFWTNSTGTGKKINVNTVN